MVSGECVLYIILYQVGCWVPAVDYKSDPYVPATVQVQVLILIPGNYIYTGSRHPAKKEKEKKNIFISGRNKTKLVAEIRFPMGNRLRPKPNAVHLFVCFAVSNHTGSLGVSYINPLTFFPHHEPKSAFPRSFFEIESVRPEET